MQQNPLPKPGSAPAANKQNKKGGSVTPPPSALKPSTGNVVFKADDKKTSPAPVAKSRIPLAQKPVAKTPLPTKKGEIKMPPSSLSALSSMSSNKIPKPGQAAPVPKAPEAQKTVLGRPIPQSIRGEATPKGMAGQPVNPGQVPAPVRGVNKNSPLPVSKTAPAPVKKSAKDDGKKKDPKFAIKKSNPVLKFLPFIIGGVLLLAIIGFVLSKVLGGDSQSVSNNVSTNSNTTAQQNPSSGNKGTEVPAQQIIVNYWGLWEPSDVMQEIISEFETQNPGTKIVYTKQLPRDYRERLQTSIESGEGPDIFRYHASWIPMLKNVLSPIPSSVISSQEFADNYYPVVTEQLVVSGQYVGVPLMYDGLSLFYNEDILDSASEIPPSTWADLRTLASKLTINSATGIERAGLAIGNASNVDHFSDIIATLMLQNGADFADPNSKFTEDALMFYTNFLTKDKVWSDSLPNSTVAFARGDVAMIFAPSWRAHEIQALNPELNFKAAPMPQLSDERVTWASYWVEGISTNSKQKESSSSFLAYMSSDENLQKLYAKASEIRAFGEPYPKVNMAEKLVDDPIVSPILEDAIDAQSWYLNSFTHDNGINDQMIGYYKIAIESIIDGVKAEDVLISLEAGTKQILKQYSVNTK